MSVEFKPKDALGDPTAIEVRKQGILIGHVRTNPSNGHFQFFKGQHNFMTCALEDSDLNRLKEKIAQIH